MHGLDDFPLLVTDLYEQQDGYHHLKSPDYTAAALPPAGCFQMITVQVRLGQVQVSSTVALVPYSTTLVLLYD